MPERSTPLLFTPLRIAGRSLKNRVVVGPMCQYSAIDGLANDWHVVQLGRFAVGGAALVFAEATGVEARGRITHGCLGLWHDGQIAPLKRIADFARAQGAIPGIQLAHAGRKAATQRPWHGMGALTERDVARGEVPWDVVGPSGEAAQDGWLVPHELSIAEIGELRQSWRDATRRAATAGFEALEIHGAHGYLIHSFLSPLGNKRGDAYGGDLAGRMRFALEIAQTVRAAWPRDLPLFFRVSAVDAAGGVGWQIADSVVLAKELKARGIDVIDCSSGGIAAPGTAALVPRSPGFQVPFATAIKQGADIATMAIGLILEADQAEDILEEGRADLIGVARQMLADPNWPVHAAQQLGHDPGYGAWPTQHGWWLSRRAKALATSRAD